MATPAIGTVETVVSAASNTTACTSGTKTVATGDIFIVVTLTENTGAGQLLNSLTDSNSRITWTKYKEITGSSQCYAGLWYGTVASTGTTTVQASGMSTNAFHSMTVWQITGGQLAATPAFISSTAGGSAPSVNITTTAANSLVIVGHGDFNAVAPGSPAYRSSAVQDGIHDKSPGNYVAYYYHAAVSSASTVAIGQTSPTGQGPAMVAIEVKEATAAAARVPARVTRQAVNRAATI